MIIMEHDNVAMLCWKIEENCWIGLTGFNRPEFDSEIGWKWSDNSTYQYKNGTIIFHNFPPNYPDNREGVEDCAAIRGFVGTWNDYMYVLSI